MKSIISTILILSIVQLQGSRLLKSTACTLDVRICPDGSHVSRDGNNGCKFPKCPDPVEGGSCTGCPHPRCACTKCENSMESYGCCGKCIYKYNKNNELICSPVISSKDDICPDVGNCDSYSPDDVKKCPDGSSVSRDPSNNCEFEPCPSCDSIDCKDGDNCYETSTGPICCDPNICVTGKCGGNGLVECDSESECVANPSCPDGLTDCPGVCIDIDAKPSVGCGIDHCNSYNDGCNDCICGDNGLVGCTKKFCPDDAKTEPYCTGCEDGYRLHEITKKCEQFIPTPRVPDVVGCGIDHCNSYNDGCNSCSCGDNGMPLACTLMFCPPEERGEPYCIGCEDGYKLNQLTKKCEEEV